jgi:hypothetical protein
VQEAELNNASAEKLMIASKHLLPSRLTLHYTKINAQAAFGAF